jgi:hypothetical protein
MEVVTMNEPAARFDCNIVPAQWRQVRPWSPEQELFGTILSDALDRLRGVPLPGRADITARIQREALAWFMSPHMDVMVNLADVCDALGLDVRSVQRSVLPVIRRALAC